MNNRIGPLGEMQKSVMIKVFVSAVCMYTSVDLPWGLFISFYLLKCSIVEFIDRLFGHSY